MPSRAPRSRLVGASTALATKRATTAATMVIRPRDGAIRGPVAMAGGDAVSAVIVPPSVPPRWGLRDPRAVFDETVHIPKVVHKRFTPRPKSVDCDPSSTAGASSHLSE